MNAAKQAFSEYLDSTNLDSRQIYFVNQIVEYIVQNGMMKDLSVLQDSRLQIREVLWMSSQICLYGWGSGR